MSSPTVGIAILTLNAERNLPLCLPPLIASPLHPRILVLDSSSEDRSVAVAQELGAETLIIPRHEFNHGLTRELARQKLQTDIVVMITPDAYAIDQTMLEKLIAPIIEGKAAAAYARQLPHDGADIFEAFPRLFNYPEESQLRSLADVGHYGAYTFFCSDSCAAYSNKSLDSIGGFRHVLLGEDTVAVSMLLRQGLHIAYVAEACVKHSHRYTLWQEFKRYFDTGIARAHYGHLLAGNSADKKRGKEYLKQMTVALWKTQPHLLPYAWLHTFVKWLGYNCGSLFKSAPAYLKKKLSSQPYFWAKNQVLYPID